MEETDIFKKFLSKNEREEIAINGYKVVIKKFFVDKHKSFLKKAEVYIMNGDEIVEQFVVNNRSKIALLSSLRKILKVVRVWRKN